MSKNLRMGVVGCGFFGQKHADCIHQIGNAELVAVCDINVEAAKALGENSDAIGMQATKKCMKAKS